MKRIIAGAAAALLTAAGLCSSVSAERWVLSEEQIEAARADKLIVAKYKDHWTLLPETEFYPVVDYDGTPNAVVTLDKDCCYRANPERLCIDRSVFADATEEQVENFLQMAVISVSDDDLGLMQSGDSYVLAYYNGAGYFDIMGEPLVDSPTYRFAIMLQSGKQPVEFFDQLYTSYRYVTCRVYADGVTLGFLTAEEMENENSLVIVPDAQPDAGNRFYVDRENRLLEAYSLEAAMEAVPAGQGCEIIMENARPEVRVLEGDAGALSESAAQAGLEFETRAHTTATKPAETEPVKKTEEHPVLFTLTTLFTLLSAGLLFLIVFTWIRFS